MSELVTSRPASSKSRPPAVMDFSSQVPPCGPGAAGAFAETRYRPAERRGSRSCRPPSRARSARRMRAESDSDPWSRVSCARASGRPAAQECPARRRRGRTGSGRAGARALRFVMSRPPTSIWPIAHNTTGGGVAAEASVERPGRPREQTRPEPPARPGTCTGETGSRVEPSTPRRSCSVPA